MEEEKQFRHKVSSFLTDEDGISIEDTLTIIIIVFFVITKLIHMYIIIKYHEIKSILEYYIVVMDDINAFTNVVILFYFGSNTFNTGAPRVVDAIKAIKGNKTSDEINKDEIISNIGKEIVTNMSNKMEEAKSIINKEYMNSNNNIDNQFEEDDGIG